MSSLFWLTAAEMDQLRLLAKQSIHWINCRNVLLPRSLGKPRVDDRPLQSGFIFINRYGLRWLLMPTSGCERFTS